MGERVSRAFDTASALKELSFSMAGGSQWAIAGPSGSGKSTLLYLLGALDRPTAGTLSVGGQNLTDLDPNARALYRYSTIGFVFQEFGLLDDLTVEETVLLPFVGRPRERRRHLDRAVWLLDQVGVGRHRRTPAGVLSGAEKQRVAIARALVNDPPLLLCDEPTGNLDQENGRQVMDLLPSLARGDDPKTLLVVTHDPAIAGRFRLQLSLTDGALVFLEQ